MLPTLIKSPTALFPPKPYGVVTQDTLIKRILRPELRLFIHGHPDYAGLDRGVPFILNRADPNDDSAILIWGGGEHLPVPAFATDVAGGSCLRLVGEEGGYGPRNQSLLTLTDGTAHSILGLVTPTKDTADNQDRFALIAGVYGASVTDADRPPSLGFYEGNTGMTTYKARPAAFYGSGNRIYSVIQTTERLNTYCKVLLTSSVEFGTRIWINGVKVFELLTGLGILALNQLAYQLFREPHLGLTTPGADVRALLMWDGLNLDDPADVTATYRADVDAFANGFTGWPT